MQRWQNDSWTYPGMFWRFMLDRAPNVSYTDYKAGDNARADAILDKMADKADVIVVTTQYSRGGQRDVRPFLNGLRRFNKPVVYVTNNPYKLVVTDEMDTVVCCYGLGHESLEAASRFLYEGPQ